MELLTMPAFVTITYLLCELYEWWASDKGDKAIDFIPVLSGIIGLLLGILSFYITPDFIGADNVFIAAAIGISSGLAAVGVDQIKKHS